MIRYFSFFLLGCASKNHHIQCRIASTDLQSRENLYRFSLQKRLIVDSVKLHWFGFLSWAKNVHYSSFNLSWELFGGCVTFTSFKQEEFSWKISWSQSARHFKLPITTSTRKNSADATFIHASLSLFKSEWKKLINFHCRILNTECSIFFFGDKLRS